MSYRKGKKLKNVLLNVEPLFVVGLLGKLAKGIADVFLFINISLLIQEQPS